MMKVKWLKRFNNQDPGHVATVDTAKANVWIASGLVKEVKPKKVAKPPKDKMVRTDDEKTK